MIQLGIDIVSIHRIDRLKNNENFLKKFLRPNEIKLAKCSKTLAGFWAAKEAASKALKCGICKNCCFYDIKLTKTNLGAPKLKFSKKVKKLFGVKKTELSISHDGNFAIAVVCVKLKRKK